MTTSGRINQRGWISVADHTIKMNATGTTIGYQAIRHQRGRCCMLAASGILAAVGLWRGGGLGHRASSGFLGSTASVSSRESRQANVVSACSGMVVPR